MRNEIRFNDLVLFGKYNGKLIGQQVAIRDPQYIFWCEKSGVPIDQKTKKLAIEMAKKKARQ